MSKLPYGYKWDESKNIYIEQQEAATVKTIFQSYLDGNSLGKIAETLTQRGISSPSHKETWSRSVLDNMLSNGKYVPCIISMERFVEVQMAKDSRSNIDYDSNTRKTTRYSSGNVLRGLSL